MKTMAYYQVCNTATESVVVERHLFKSSKHANLESVICLYVNIAWEVAADRNKKMAHIVCGIFCQAYFIEVKAQTITILSRQISGVILQTLQRFHSSFY